MGVGHSLARPCMAAVDSIHTLYRFYLLGSVRHREQTGELSTGCSVATSLSIPCTTGLRRPVCPVGASCTTYSVVLSAPYCGLMLLPSSRLLLVVYERSSPRIAWFPAIKHSAIRHHSATTMAYPSRISRPVEVLFRQGRVYGS